MPAPLPSFTIDCDLYSPASCVLTHLVPRIGPGCVLLFDEFFNYPGWQQHEYKAFLEFIAATGLGFRYHSVLQDNQPVCVVIEA